MTHPAPLSLAAVLALLFLPAGAAAAERAVGLSAKPVAESRAWRSLVLDSPTPTVSPKRVAVEGDKTAVENPDGLKATGGGATTLRQGGTLVLDLGLNAGGRVEVDVTMGDGATVRLAYAERRALLTPDGDTVGSSLGTDDDPGGRFDTFTANDGTTFVTPAVRGAQRWILVRLDTPGTVSIDAVRVRITSLRPSVADYTGHFLSSDTTLNKAWYASAYTHNLSVTNNVILDGGKRDRMAFSGDLGIAQLTGLSSVRQGPAVARSSLWRFSCLQAPSGHILGYADTSVRCPATPPAPSAANDPTLASGEYVAWYVVAVAEYARETGDDATAKRLLPVLRRAIGFLRGREDGGLYTAPPGTPIEFNWRAGLNFGASSYTNIVYVRALRALAELEARVGSGTAASKALERHADTVRDALLKRLWDKQAGAFLVNTTATVRDHAQDANVQAIVAGGILPPRDAERALHFVTTKLATRYGTKNAERDDDPLVPQYISPFTSSWELLARFEQNDAAGALGLIRRLWGHMLRSDPGSTAWEKVALDGTPQPNSGAGQGLPTTRPEGEGYVSLAHAWSTGPGVALSRYVLGVRSSAPGFARWSVAPQVSDLRWAKGTVPTPRGAIASRWERTSRSFRLTVVAPRGTTGTVAVPLLGRAGRVIARDGVVVWSGGRAARGVRAERVGDAVRFSSGPGTHTYAWG